MENQDVAIEGIRLNYTETLPGHEASVPFSEIDLFPAGSYEELFEREEKRRGGCGDPDRLFAERPGFLHSEDPYVIRRIGCFFMDPDMADIDARRHAFYQLMNIVNLERAMEKISKVHSPDLEKYLNLEDCALFECIEDLDENGILYTCEDAAYTLELRFSTQTERRQSLDGYAGVAEMLEGRHGRKDDGSLHAPDLEELRAYVDGYGSWLWQSKAENARLLRDAIHRGMVGEPAGAPEPPKTVRRYF